MTRTEKLNFEPQSEGIVSILPVGGQESTDSPGPKDEFAWACPACHGPLALRDGSAHSPATGSTGVPPAPSDPGGRDGRALTRNVRLPSDEGLEGLDEIVAVCNTCGRRFPKRDGVWRFLLADRKAAHRDFLRDYQQVRSTEEWGSQDPTYYRSLPDVSLRDRSARIWNVRKGTFRLFLERVVLPLERSTGRELVVFDLGAGNGWLAHRLASRGHSVAAVDLSVDDRDGLGAIERYRVGAAGGSTGRLSPVQADFDHLPYQAGQADLVVFNASFHYSLGYERTLGEARRVLRPGGLIAVLDTPFYSTAAPGVAMLRDRDAGFREAYGIEPSTRPAEGFLDADRWQALRETSGMIWRKQHSVCVIRRTLRRSMTTITGRREPACFPVFVGQLLADGDHAPRNWETGARIKALLARSRLRLEFRFLLRNRLDRDVVESVAGRRLVVYPSVFNPVLFRSGRFFAETLSTAQVPPGSDLLDLGTGSGLGAIVTSEWARNVVAVDVNPEAVRCARFNATQLGLGTRIDVREGDLFQSVPGETFDVILFNPPYYRGSPRDEFDRAWRSNDVVERFASQLGEHLNPAGRALVVLSTDGDSADFIRTFVRSGWLPRPVSMRHFANESFTLYRLTRAFEVSDDCPL